VQRPHLATAQIEVKVQGIKSGDQGKFRSDQGIPVPGSPQPPFAIRQASPAAISRKRLVFTTNLSDLFSKESY
jgi:hypothetical protein